MAPDMALLQPGHHSFVSRRYFSGCFGVCMHVCEGQRKTMNAVLQDCLVFFIIVVVVCCHMYPVELLLFHLYMGFGSRQGCAAHAFTC